MKQGKQPKAIDHISIHGLRFSCIVGIHEWERKHRQPIAADIELELDLRSAGRSDDIEETADYSRLAGRIVREAEQTRYFLLEALAQRIADLCLSAPRVHGVTVLIWKRKRRRIYRKASISLVRRK